MHTTPENGTDPQPIADYFVQYAGIPAKYIHGNGTSTVDRLMKEIDHGRPPIVDLQAWRLNDSVMWNTDWDDGHYNVCTLSPTSLVVLLVVKLKSLFCLFVPRAYR